MYIMQAYSIILMWFPTTSAADVMESCEKYCGSGSLIMLFASNIAPSNSCSLKTDNDEPAFIWHKNLNNIFNLNISSTQQKMMINGFSINIPQINMNQVDLDVEKCSLPSLFLSAR